MKCPTAMSFRRDFLMLLVRTSRPRPRRIGRARALEKSPRHHEWVTVKHGDRSVETFVVYPESKHKRPVVLVIHEIFGMTDWAQEVSDEVAEAGYIAVAPDLLSGMAPNGGRTSDFAEGKATEAVSHLDRRPDHAGPERCRGLRAEASCVERQDFRRGILLGRRPELPVRDEPAGSLRGVRFLRAAAGQRRDGAYQGARVRILCRQRCSDWGYDSRCDRANEGSRENVRAGHLRRRRPRVHARRRSPRCERREQESAHQRMGAVEDPACAE